MDYTPINARRVLVGFVLTGVVAFLPILFVVAQATSLSLDLSVDLGAVYRAVMLGVVSVVVMAALVSMVALMVVSARRAMGRLSRV